MKLLRLAPENTKFGFMRFRRVSYPLSALLSIVAVTLFFAVGMNFGIDFAGGTQVELRAKSGVADLADGARQGRQLSELGPVQAQCQGASSDDVTCASTCNRAAKPPVAAIANCAKCSATLTSSAASRRSSRASPANRAERALSASLLRSWRC